MARRQVPDESTLERRTRYEKFCSQEQDVPLFSQPWWLDAVAGASWDVVLAGVNEIHGSMPIAATNSRYRLPVFGMPPLTQTLGPYIRPSQKKLQSAISFRQQVLSELIEGLPDHLKYQQNWHHSQTDWLPFYWKGFRQTTRYTYILPDITDPDRLWSEFSGSMRNVIRKSADRYGMRVVKSDDVSRFLPLHRGVFTRQGSRSPFTDDLLLRVHSAISRRKAGAIYLAVDDRGEAHAGALIAQDRATSYYLLGGSDDHGRKSGAVTHCLWEAIKDCSASTRSFDFEGSMIAPIERYFRSFGSTQTPYFSVEGHRNRFWQSIDTARALLA